MALFNCLEKVPFVLVRRMRVERRVTGAGAGDGGVTTSSAAGDFVIGGLFADDSTVATICATGAFRVLECRTELGLGVGVLFASGKYLTLAMFWAHTIEIDLQQTGLLWKTRYDM